MLQINSRPCPGAPIAGTRLALSSRTKHQLASRRPTAALRRHVLVHAQRRRLFGEGGSTPDGSASGSSSDEDAPLPTAQPPQQQQRQAAAAAEAERQRKRQDALRRIEASTARLRKRGTGSAMVDAVLQQMYERELAADAADIVASSPSTLKQQLAQEGADLEADWAEAEAASTGALTTTGRAKTLAALAASKGLSPADVLRPARPMMRPELPFSDSYDSGDGFDDFDDDDDDDDDDAWQDILEADDLPLWEDSRSSAAGKDPVAAAAASIRRQIDDPAFQAWLQQQERERAAKEARSRREAELQAKLQAGASAVDRLRRKQEAADLARMQFKLQSSSSQGAARPLARPNAPAGSGSSSGGWEDDVVLDPSNVKKSDVGLTPAQMAALLEEFGADEPSSSSGSSNQRLSAPVFTPKPGYSFSGPARAAASRLADASASGQLQRPLLVRPSVRPAGTAGGSVLDQQLFWDDDEAEAAAAAAAEAERKALIQSLLADQELQQQPAQQQQRRPQQAAAPAVDADRVAAAADNLKKAIFNASLKRPGGRPGAAPAQANQQPPSAAAAKLQQPGDRFAAAAAALQRPSSRPGQQQDGQQGADTAWDAEEAAAAAAAQQEADRLALLQQLQAEAEAADLIAFALAASEPQQQTPSKNKPAPKGPVSSSSSSSGAVSAKPALQGLKRPSNRPTQPQQPQQPQQQQQQAQARNTASLPPAQPKQRGVQPPQRPKAPPRPDLAVAQPEQQDGQEELWDEAEAAEARAAQADAARRQLLIELAEKFLDAAAANSAGATASVPEAQAAKKGTSSSSSRQSAAAAPPAQPIQKPAALSGLRKPPARPAQQSAQATAPKNATKQQASTKQQQAGKQAKQQPGSQKQQGRHSQRELAAAAAAAAAAAEEAEAAITSQQQETADTAEQVLDTAKGNLRKQGRQPQQSADPTVSGADRAALKQGLEQAAQALQPLTPQLQRPARPPAATSAAAAAAAAATGAAASAGKPPRPAQPSSSRKKERVSVDLQSPRQQQSADTAEAAMDWRFRQQQQSAQQQSAQAGAGDWRLPRTIPADKLQFAQYLEATRTPTTAVVRGVAAKQDRDVSLVLQLEELGCVTLMPVSHLLPSQRAQLCREAGLDAGRFPSGSLRAQGRLGEAATAALQGWKGRRLDVIVSTMRQPHYSASAARERLVAGIPPLKRNWFGFWHNLTLTCMFNVWAALPGHEGADRSKSPWLCWQGVESPQMTRFKQMRPDDWSKIEQLTASVAADLQECLTDPSTLQQAAAALLGADADGNLPDRSVRWNIYDAVEPFQLLLAQLQVQGRLPDAAASILFELESSSPNRFARCVAVATWPPAWLDEQQQAEALAGSSSSSSSSSSGSVLWVAEREQLQLQQGPSQHPTYTRGQVRLWEVAPMHGVKWRGRETSPPKQEDAVFSTQVVGVHPQGYLLCQTIPHVNYRELSRIPLATVAVPLSQCPPSLRLSMQQQQQQQEQEQQGEAAVGSSGTGGLQLYDQEAQPRWEPWGLQEAAAAAAGTSGSSGTGSGLDASELQAWRQGVLALWRKPHLSVKVQLLPLEQQQDPACLRQETAYIDFAALPANQEFWKGTSLSEQGILSEQEMIKVRLSEDCEASGSAPQEEQQRPRSSSGGFGDSLNLLLLGRIVEEEKEEVVVEEEEEG